MTENNITQLLESVNQGDREAFDRLINALYSELRRLSAILMKRESPGHLLQPTALVNEAFIRLFEGEPRWENRRHFFGAAAKAMRRVLIDYARSRAALKRGGAVNKMTFDELAVASDDRQLDLFALDEALKALEAEDQRLVQVVELRYFGGFSIEETAEILGISPATVKRDWLYARAWLLTHMKGA